MIGSEPSVSWPPLRAGRWPRARRDRRECLSGGSTAGLVAEAGRRSALGGGGIGLAGRCLGGAGRMARGQHSSDLAAAGGSRSPSCRQESTMNCKYGAGGGGVTVPHRRTEASCRVARGGPAGRATCPRAPDAGICWSARQRGSGAAEGRGKTLPGQRIASRFQGSKTVRWPERAGLTPAQC